MKCKHCGKEIDNDSVFCEFCGGKVINMYDSVILDILDSIPADKPMAAYNARKECYKYCKKEHPYDYKEYVKRLMAEEYPRESKRCDLDIRYVRRYVILSILCTACFCIACLVQGGAFNVFCYAVSGEVYCIRLSDYDYSNSTWMPSWISYEHTVYFIISSVIGLCSLLLMAFRKKWYRRKIQKML